MLCLIWFVNYLCLSDFFRIKNQKIAYFVNLKSHFPLFFGLKICDRCIIFQKKLVGKK